MAMELSLDLCLTHVPTTVSDLLREVSVSRDSSEKMVRIEDYVNRLEDEMRKIDAFKRELPLCMLLLTDAVVRLKEAMRCTDSRNLAVVEEFLPLKENSGEDDAEKEKKTKWLGSALLFDPEIKKHGPVLELNLRSEKENRSPTEKPCGYRNRGGGAFVPFKKTVSEVSKVPALCLAAPSPEVGFSDEKPKIGGSGGGGTGSGCPVLGEKVKSEPQAARKQRRCWSPELHRRFVDALRRLGGWKVGTPKQIREIMQVEGLTNDEVKSHLQKYRLHIRKLPSSSNCRENVSWMDGEVCEEVNNSESGSVLGGMCSNGDDSVEDDKSEVNV